jgi:hypothetical protein
MVKGLAFIHFKIDAEGKLHIKKEHVRRLKELLDHYEKIWELDLMLVEEQQFRLSVLEAYTAIKSMKTKAPHRYKIYSEIAMNGRVTFEHLVRVANSTESKVFSELAILQKNEIISRPKGGFFVLTPLGQNAHRFILTDLKRFIKAEDDDISDLILDTMRRCKRDSNGWVSSSDLISHSHGINSDVLFEGVRTLKQKGNIKEHEIGKFEILS